MSRKVEITDNEVAILCDLIDENHEAATWWLVDAVEKNDNAATKRHAAHLVTLKQVKAKILANDFQ